MITIFICMQYGDDNDLETRRCHAEHAMRVWHILADAGFQPYCPLLSHFLHELSPRPRKHWLAQSRAWVDKCDCLLVVGLITEGMKQEIADAHFSHIPVFGSIDQLAAAYGMEVRQ